jgi:hypothetical protein
MWLVVHEYETYCHDEPVHAWTVLDSKKTKKEAEEVAINLNYKYYCENFPHRWQGKLDKNAQKPKIVKFVLNNINSKTGSDNGKFGTGIWIIDSSKFNIDPEKKHITSLDETCSYLDETGNRSDESGLGSEEDSDSDN